MVWFAYIIFQFIWLSQYYSDLTNRVLGPQDVATFGFGKWDPGYFREIDRSVKYYEPFGQINEKSAAKSLKPPKSFIIYFLPMGTMKLLKLPKKNRLHLQRISWWLGVNGKRFFAHFLWDVLCPRNEPTTTRASRKHAKPLVDVSMKTWRLYLWHYSNWMQLVYVPLYLYI